MMKKEEELNMIAMPKTSSLHLCDEGLCCFLLRLLNMV